MLLVEVSWRSHVHKCFIYAHESSELETFGTLSELLTTEILCSKFKLGCAHLTMKIRFCQKDAN